MRKQIVSTHLADSVHDITRRERERERDANRRKERTGKYMRRFCNHLSAPMFAAGVPLHHVCPSCVAVSR